MNDPRHELSADDLAQIAADVLDRSPLPALVLEIPSERIVASSPVAAQLLAPGDHLVVGRRLEDFTADRPATGIDLFAGGRLNGFETFRTIRRTGGADLTIKMWIRTFAGQPATHFVLVLLVAEPFGADGTDDTSGADQPAVVGAAAADLVIDRISSDAEILFGRPVAELIGHPLTALIAADDESNCLAAVAEASRNDTGVTLFLDIRPRPQDGTDRVLRCEALFLPLQPPGSCAFVFLPTVGVAPQPHVAGDLSAILARLGNGARIARLARGVLSGITERDVPGLSRLTVRELELVARLLDGDRVPTIARGLSLSQSTVRNHLTAVFAKLGIGSQQELIIRFRTVRQRHEG